MSKSASHGRALLTAALAGLALACTVPAFAHSEHGKPMHGGVVAEAGVFQGELVAAPAGLTLHLYDHGAPLPAAGATARLTVLAGAQKSEVALSPAGENRLTAPAGTVLPKGAKVVAAVKLADGRNGALRSELK